MPKVSIIIPCYNQGQYIDESVNSVLDQTFKDIEIIIVNDGSTDEFTNKKLSNYNKPKTKVIQTENRGVSAARNTAIKNSTGTYIISLDGDDKIEKTYIEKAFNIIEKDSNIKIVYCDLKLFGYKNKVEILPEFNYDFFFTQNIIHVSGLFKREDYNKVGGYDENIKKGLEDWEFWISMLKSGGDVYKINEPLLFYRQTVDSRQLKLDNDIEIKNKIRNYIEQKHSDFYYNRYGSILSLARENQNLLQKIKRLENSKAYKIGRIILFPMKIIFRR